MSFAPTCRRCGHRELRGLSGAVTVDRPEPGCHEVTFACTRCGGPAVDVVERRRPGPASPDGPVSEPASTGTAAPCPALRSTHP